MDKETLERIEALIKMYQGSARNLRNVADLAAGEDIDSVVAHKSRAKASTYDLVVADLENLIERKG